MKVAVLGEALIDLIVDDDGSYRPHLGGSPYNVAIGLARQGVDVSYVSPLSDDTFGDQLHDSLIAESVQLPITWRSRRPTSIAMVTIDDDGAATYRIYRDGIADKDISFEQVAEALPPDLKLFHTGSLAITPGEVPKIRQLFKLMRERGVTISMDINIRLRACLDTCAYLAGVRSLLPMADIVKASDEDLEPFKIANNPRDAAAAAYSEMGSGILVLTEGAAGAVLYSDAGTIEASAIDVDDIQDTVGAGDTFHAALLASLLRSKHAGQSLDGSVLKQALDFASVAAAINLSRAGCNPPIKSDVENFVS